jgi:peptide/nickel transport system ATP-binding protein
MSEMDAILSLEHLGVSLPKGADRPHALSDVSAWSANPAPASR